jgi:hypothetical protein
MCADPHTRPALPLRVSSPLPLMVCVTGAIMAHGDTEVARDDVADVTIIPATKDGDADTKRILHPEEGKSNRCVNVVHALNIRVRVRTADPRVSATCGLRVSNIISVILLEGKNTLLKLYVYTVLQKLWCNTVGTLLSRIQSVCCITETVVQHSADTAEQNTKSVL